MFVLDEEITWQLLGNINSLHIDISVFTVNYNSTCIIIFPKRCIGTEQHGISFYLFKTEIKVLDTSGKVSSDFSFTVNYFPLYFLNPSLKCCFNNFCNRTLFSDFSKILLNCARLGNLSLLFGYTFGKLAYFAARLSCSSSFMLDPTYLSLIRMILIAFE